MRRYLYAAAVAAVAALLTAIPALASGNAVLTDPAGNVATSTTVSGTNSGNATISLSAGGSVTCANSTTTATVSTNPTAPGTATLSLTGLTFSNCTPHNVSGVSAVNSITANVSTSAPYGVSITSPTTDSVTISPASGSTIDVTASVRTNFGFSVSCSYHAHGGNVSGTAPNATIVISGAQFDLDANQNFLCSANTTLGVTYSETDPNGAVSAQ